MKLTGTTILVDVDDGLTARLTFGIGKEREVLVEIPSVVDGTWIFPSDAKEDAFMGYLAAISNEYRKFGQPPEEVAGKFQTMMKRAVKSGILRKTDA